MKKYGSINGLFIGLAAIFGAYFIEGGKFSALFLLPSLLIVFGGTFGAVIIGFGFDRFKNVFNLMKMAYFPKKYDINILINGLVHIAMKGRREGLLSVENELFQLRYVFPQKMIRFVLDGTDTDSLEIIARTEMKAMQERHYSNINIFSKMGGYAPTMGIIGTVMGLIMTLANAGNEPNVLIHNIASAFIATLWGILSANLIWLPIADKLKQCHLEEKHMMEISLEGVLALQGGEIPSIVKSRLISMLPQREQEEYLQI